MTNITVRICTGTVCYVSGGSDLLTLEEHLPEALRARVEILGVPCLERCHAAADTARPPFVQIGNRCFGSMNMERLIEKIEGSLEDDR